MATKLTPFDIWKAKQDGGGLVIMKMVQHQGFY